LTIPFPCRYTMRLSIRDAPGCVVSHIEAARANLLQKDLCDV
jgi:hypothetical protein